MRASRLTHHSRGEHSSHAGCMERTGADAQLCVSASITSKHLAKSFTRILPNLESNRFPSCCHASSHNASATLSLLCKSSLRHVINSSRSTKPSPSTSAIEKSVRASQWLWQSMEIADSILCHCLWMRLLLPTHIEHKS